jgi:leucyl aminopeptidase
MRITILGTALMASSVAAFSLPKGEAQELLTIKLSPTEFKQVTEEEKFALKAVSMHSFLLSTRNTRHLIFAKPSKKNLTTHTLQAGKNFIDITNHPSLVHTGPLNPHNRLAPQAHTAGPSSSTNTTFPATLIHQNLTNPLLTLLSEESMRTNLNPFITFQNRFYKSPHGAESFAWLLTTIQTLLKTSNATRASARAFPHSFVQSSIIATLPGLSNRTIVMGAHQDSVNWKNSDQINNRAPGADDDGSGVVTILEAMRVLLTNEDVRMGRQPNTIEFHWYAAEEGGLLGSSDVWQSYKSEGRDAKALLQQDMTGWSKGTTDKGKPEAMGIIVDYVDAGLTTFIKGIVDEVCFDLRSLGGGLFGKEMLTFTVLSTVTSPM